MLQLKWDPPQGEGFFPKTVYLQAFVFLCILFSLSYKVLFYLFHGIFFSGCHSLVNQLLGAGLTIVIGCSVVQKRKAMESDPLSRLYVKLSGLVWLKLKWNKNSWVIGEFIFSGLWFIWIYISFFIDWFHCLLIPLIKGEIYIFQLIFIFWVALNISNDLSMYHIVN